MIGSVAIIGLGLLGGSIGLAVQEFLPEVRTAGYDADVFLERKSGQKIMTGRPGPRL